MASSPSQSPSPQHPLAMSSPPPLHPQPTPPSAKPPGRRIPPPCWSNDETAALIDSYRDKWHSLSRGNLRAAHWQEVADGVAARFPGSAVAKTPLQCRHKMEKLRKRYRSELRRSLSAPPKRRFKSSWVLFDKIHDMEKAGDDADVEIDDGLGLRSKKFGELSPDFDSRVCRDAELGGKGKGGGGLNGMVDAMKMLGEGFVKMERMKMEMVREIEQTRMEMERKRAQMMMESQRRLVEVFVKGIPEMMGKKAKNGEFLGTKEVDS